MNFSEEMRTADETFARLRRNRKDYQALLRVARAAKCAEDVLDRITQSFPDNEVPHPSIEECLNTYCDLAKALKEVERLLAVDK